MYPPHSSTAIPTMVRAERTWAGIAAALLCYYGFFGGMIPLTTAADILLYTAKIGGVAMVVSVVLLSTGKLFALAYDGLASLLIGGALILSGVLWITGGPGIQGILNIVFGGMFASAGWRNWSLFTQMRSVDVTAPRRPADPRTQPEQHQPPSDSLAGRIKRQREQQSPDPPSAPTPPIAKPAQPDPGPAPDLTLEPPPPAKSPPAPAAQSEPPAEDESAEPPSSLESMPPLSSSTKGFLASFADADDDDEEEKSG